MCNLHSQLEMEMEQQKNPAIMLSFPFNKIKMVITFIADLVFSFEWKRSIIYAYAGPKLFKDRTLSWNAYFFRRPGKESPVIIVIIPEESV